jgi:hypothetical protein
VSEITEAVHEIKVEEVAEATVLFLNDIYVANPTMTVKKATIIPKIAKLVAEGRRIDGYNYIPTVENRAVREPNEKWIINNWKHVTLFIAEELEKYIVWDRDGVRLGTFEEYQEQQEMIENIADGVASSFNRRATIINSRGGESVYISVNVFQLPEGDCDGEETG